MVDNTVQEMILKSEFEYTQIKSWIYSNYQYIIDSKFRTLKRLDYFLKYQLQDPTNNLIDAAKKLRKKNPDETIIAILGWVFNKVLYASDDQAYGRVEYWATADETLKKGRDDCDGINGLIYVVARLCGISPDVIYCVIGNVGESLHFYCLYWSTTQDKMYAIDATVFPSFIVIPKRITYSELKYYQFPKYIFNENIIIKPY